jgi:hypothetical protein
MTYRQILTRMGLLAGYYSPRNTTTNKQQLQQRQRQQQRQQPNRIQRTNQPVFSGTSNGIRVRHREYLTSISISNAGFEVWSTGTPELGNFMTLPMNPGDGAFSPWLATIASNYEYYEFMNLKLVYSPSVSSFTSGAILLSPEFDPHNERTTPPTTLSDFLNKQHAVTGNVWSEFQLSIPKNKLGKKLVRPEHTLSVSTSHLRQTDVGQIYVALYNVESTQSIPYGELFVEYDVMLTIPNQSNNTVKHYQYHLPNPEQDHLGFNKGALFGNDGNAAKRTDEPQFVGKGTIGVSHQYIQGAGLSGGQTADCSRFVFNEPFRGTLTIGCNQHSGAMPSSALPTMGHDPVNGITYDPDYEPKSVPKTSESHIVNTGGTGADILGLWNIVSAAGDVLDMFWSDAGTWGFNDIMMGLAEVGELLPLLL